MMTFEEIISHQLFQDVLRFPIVDRECIREKYETMANSDGHKHWLKNPISFFKLCMLSVDVAPSGAIRNCFRFVLSLSGQNLAIELDQTFAPWSKRNKDVAMALLQEVF